MKNKKSQPKIAKQLAAVQKQLNATQLDETVLCNVATGLAEVGDLARETANETLERGAELLAKISELAASCSGDESNEESDHLTESMIEFLGENIGVLGDVAKGVDRASEVESFIEFANESWQDYLALFADESFPTLSSEPWTDLSDPLKSTDDAVDDETDQDALSSDQIKMMLAALSGSGVVESPAEVTTDASVPGSRKQASTSTRKGNASATRVTKSAADDNEDSLFGTPPAKKPFDPDAYVNGEDPDADARRELAKDRELLEAFLDDALRCLSSMEQAAMTIEESPDDHDTGRQFCRELHTLKGAAGSVGLRGLASQLHDLESSLETMFAMKNETLDADPLFAAVDRVRIVIDSLHNGGVIQETANLNTPAKDTNSSLPTGLEPRAKSENLAEGPASNSIEPQRQIRRPTPTDFGFNANDDASIRIRASKLDRLMDMLAELVVLRNRRESHVNEFNELNAELVRCSARVGFADEQFQYDLSEGEYTDPSSMPQSLTNMTEVAKDIAAVSQGLRELQKPVIQDNTAISRFIRDFRQELMQLRRVPVSGLFNRLQRAARDAAKTEGKKIRIVLEGQHAGLEQEIQERLFDSMLHVVRNSVSHGIESPENRGKSGKEELGTITLEATSNAQLLMIEVRDDGNGIDYDAVRRRGIEKNLIRADQRLSDDQLARLIFHPGFSTRESASEVSGRGVGMDVVATTIEQMHGRIEIESKAGQGTTMRLLIPLRTGIEHVMVFRSGDQLFALPMQAVTAAKRDNANRDSIKTVSLSAALSIGRPDNRVETTGREILMLRQSSSGQQKTPGTQLAVSIDELIGPEEVVVRGLPDLLRNHPLMNGITLSGSGKKVLLLDSDRLIEFCQSHELDLSVEDRNVDANSNEQQKRVLVVDDSLTARKVLGKMLRQHGLTVVEAADGIEAVEKLRHEKFDMVMTDLDMPRMGGLELLTDIESGGYCDSPCVIVSSRNEKQFREQASDVDACEFLNKPVSKSTIAQLLEKFELLPTPVKSL